MMNLLAGISDTSILSRDETRDVKVSRLAWSRHHFVGLDLGLSASVS